MKKSSIILFTAISSFFIACNSEKGDPFELVGEIKGAENKKIILETMSFPNTTDPKYTIIDTARADETGKFIIKDHLPERMICRIKVEGDNQNYYVVSLHNEKLEINADLTKQESPLVKGSAATESLFAFLEVLRGFDKPYMQDSVLKMKSRGEDSLVTVFINGLQKQYLDMFRNYADSSKYLPNSILALESLFQDDFEFVKGYSAKKDASTDSGSVYVIELSEKVKMKDAIISKSVIGKPFIDIAQPDTEGNMLKLSDLKGNIVLIDFWASWCGPCRQENPNVTRVYNKYKDDGFKIYSVSLDTDKSRWMEAIKKDGLIWQHHVAALDDRNNKAARDYNITGIPMSFLINKDGVIVAENLRGAALEKKVAELVGR